MADNKFRYTNEKCPVCNEQFKSDDDIVVCPYCGTPHHRECYKSNSECANNDKHSENFRWEPTFVTPEEVQSEQTAENTPLGQFSNPNQLPFGMPFPIVRANPLEAFPPEMENGVKTEDVAVFVQQDAVKYIDKFFKIKEKKHTWNWAAFFFAPYWFFYRKLYKIGAVFLALFVCITSLSLLPPAVKLSEAMLVQEEKIAEMSEDIETEEEYNIAFAELTDEMTKMFKENTKGIVIMTFQSFASFVISVIIGLNANKWYYKHTISQINKVNTENQNKDDKTPIFKAGGVSYGSAFLSILAEKAIFFAMEMILSAFLH